MLRCSWRSDAHQAAWYLRPVSLFAVAALLLGAAQAASGVALIACRQQKNLNFIASGVACASFCRHNSRSLNIAPEWLWLN
ncbi:hypothetical protein CO610_09500 [Lysobacteraceae bacterium NML95-0200]|nr:hypothetical protein CO610_09500 [Xanthomonadaceae bacterium NML95-0200]